MASCVFYSLYRDENLYIFAAIFAFLSRKNNKTLKVSFKRLSICALISAFFFSPYLVFSQTTSGADFLSYGLIGTVTALFIGAVILVSSSLLKLQAERVGADSSKVNLFPSLSELNSPKIPDFASGQESVHVLKKGHDINLEGKARLEVRSHMCSRYAVKPIDFVGLSPIPKVVPAIGETVMAGDVVFYDKKNPDVIHTAPVSGEVIEINRGEKRAITEVVILADKDQRYKQFTIGKLEELDRKDIVNLLLQSGAWTGIMQRPFGVIADHNDSPRDIFISTFDSAPLAPDLNFVVSGRALEFQKGLDVLNKLTQGTVYLGLDASGEKPSDVFTEAVGVEKHWFKGKHPYGNVGIQIHHIKPLNNVDKVWTLNVQDVITIGTLFTSGEYKPERIIALTGADIDAHYVRTYAGAQVSDLFNGHLDPEKVRIVSGDVLSGETISNNGYVRRGDDQITVLDEGNYYEMFGWLFPGEVRPSVSRTYPGFLFKDMTYKADTNTHGEKRAFVMSGQYESVLPMDLYPQYLMKAIMNNDFERMEGLGILELLEEDIALCEFACTSKMPLQQILREGLDLMQDQA